MSMNKPRLNKQQRVKKKKKRLDEPIIKDRLMMLLKAENARKSISPTDVAKALDAEGWHSYLRPVRVAAAKLAKDGHIDILRKGKPVDPDEFKGVVRFRLKARDEEE